MKATQKRIEKNIKIKEEKVLKNKRIHELERILSTNKKQEGIYKVH